MRCYLIRYVLNTKGQDYKKIIDGIQRKYPTNIQIAGGTWIIKSNDYAETIRDTLDMYCDYNDDLLVVELGKDWGTKRFSTTITNWLHTYI